MKNLIIKLQILVFLVFGVIFLSGCGSIPPTTQFVPFPEEMNNDYNRHTATIILFTDEVNVTLRVWDGQKAIGDITGRSYLCWEREPGVATIHAQSWRWYKAPSMPPPSDIEIVHLYTPVLSMVYQIQIDSGQTYYIKYIVTQFITANDECYPVSEEEAQEYLAERTRPTVMLRTDTSTTDISDVMEAEPILPSFEQESPTF